MARQGISRRLTLLASTAMAVLLFSALALPALADICCSCTPPGASTATCLTASTGSCSSILTDAKNPLLAGYTCKTTALTSGCSTKVPGETGSGAGVCAVGPTNAYAFVSSAGATPNIIARAPQLNIPIPGLTFADYATLQNGSINEPFLAQYIAGWYRYLVGASVIAAAVMIVYGGFRYIIGATSNDISHSKEIIRDAIVGLFLVLGAYTILNTVNQAALLNQTLNVTYINPVAFALENSNAGLAGVPGQPGATYANALGPIPVTKAPPPTTDVAPTEPTQVPPSNAAPGTAPLPENPGGPSTAQGSCNPIGKVTYFAQAAAPWGSKPLGNMPACTNAEVPNTYSDALGRNQTQREYYGNQGNAQCCMLYGDAACGPTSLAMVLASYGENIDPGSAGAIAIAGNLRNCNSGGVSPVAIINARFPNYVYDTSLDASYGSSGKSNSPKDLPGLDTALKSGHPVIFLCQGCMVWKHTSVGKPQNKLVKHTDYWTFGGHFMVLTGVYDDGNYAVNDPSLGGYDFISHDEVASPRVQLIYIHPKDGRSINACK
ncbi:MAG: C39 family peptidase [Patescibacteria group bacterium]